VRKPVSRKPDSEAAFRRVQVARAFEGIARQIRDTNNDFFARANAHLEFHLILARATRNPILMVVMQALIGIMRQFLDTIGSQQIADYVLPSRKRFMQYFEARNADAAVKEMEQHLKRVNRNYLALPGERSKSNEIIAERR
jgi:GntR family transcriptional repressor for pyruvate dehydrogenase complex